MEAERKKRDVEKERYCLPARPEGHGQGGRAGGWSRSPPLGGKEAAADARIGHWEPKQGRLPVHGRISTQVSPEGIVVTIEFRGRFSPSAGMTCWMGSYLGFFPELNRTRLFHNIEPSGAQYCFENSSVNLLTTLAYSTWKCSLFSLALWPTGSIMSI